MLNYIWAGLIAASLVFASVSDVRDLARDAYRNGQALPIRVALPADFDAGARLVPVAIDIDPATYAGFYGVVPPPPAARYTGTLVQTQEGRQLRFAATSSLPEPLATIRGVSKSRDDELQGTLVDFTLPAAAGAPSPAAGPVVAEAAIRFEPVRFVHVNAISAAALEFAGTAATLALGLVGVLALFLGLLRIAEDAGVIYALVRLVRPLLRPLFPEIPADHPALGLIALNLAANVFGLGNAATPFGIRAMEQLQTLNPTKDTATNSMVMLLAMNTASVQLVPPVLLVALMGLQVNQLVFPIIITTGLSLLIAITAATLFARLPGSRASDPHRQPPMPSVSAGPGAGER